MFQKGNKLGGNRKVFQHELRKVLTQTPDKLRRIAEALVKKAEEGDLFAIRELVDRLDGKAHQTVSGTLEHTVNVGSSAEITPALSRALAVRSSPTVQ
jgi:hypothetical protein